jgi:hypothetical protein
MTYQASFSTYEEARHFIVECGGDLRGLTAETVDILEMTALDRNDRELLWHLTPVTDDTYGLDEWDWTKEAL